MTIIHQALLVGRKSINVIFAANTVNGSVAINGLAEYEAGQTDINVTVNSGVNLTSASAVAGLTITGGQSGDKVILNNNGIIAGGPGTGGNPLGGSVTEPNTPLGKGGSVNSNPSGETSSGNGNNGGEGGPGITYTTPAELVINNTGKITGGGGGYGGNGYNNGSGGNGGAGGKAITFIETRRITLVNTSGAVLGGGGGGGSGWGNRIPGATAGGQTGFAATIVSNGGGNFGALGQAGSVTSTNAANLFNNAGTFTL